MTNVWRANEVVVTHGNLLMLALGLLAFAAGVAMLLRRGGSEAAVVARRIAGMMALALGIFLTIFALGLSGAPEFSNA